MGFICPPGGAVADFLTAVPVHTERIIRPGFDEKVPNTAEEFESRYYQSSVWQRAKEAMVDYAALEQEVDIILNKESGTKKGLLIFGSKHSVYSTSLMEQIWACTAR